MKGTELPDLCFTFLCTNPPGKFIGAIKRGESGYYKTSYDETDPVKAQALVKHLNSSRLGLTDAQVLAMEVGSMFGWNSPGAQVGAHDDRLQKRQDFIDRIVSMYQRGEDNAYEVFLRNPSFSQLRATIAPGAEDGDLQFVRRCAEEDFNLGVSGNASYQDVYDALCPELAKKNDEPSPGAIP